ncbi:MAG: flavodoxin, partial [Ruminococcaceae bacterium]|nr:flavodoxin [Oscillospiraceae bacterium]
MKAIVIYKSKYGSTKSYAEWIGEELSCKVANASEVKSEDLSQYDTIIYGGGLYAEVIAGVSLITKNLEKLKGKKLIVFTTGLTPPEYREYYDDLVVKKNFKGDVPQGVKMFNYPGKMIISELSLVHKTAIKTLKKIMSDKKNPTEMEKLLIDLCDVDGDLTDRSLIKELVEYAK